MDATRILFMPGRLQLLVEIVEAILDFLAKAIVGIPAILIALGKLLASRGTKKKRRLARKKRY